MAETKTHCEDCKRELGETFAFEEVHLFLDQFASQFSWSHRRVLHHTYGVEIVRYFFGEMAAKAAQIHIKRDCGGDIPEPEDWLDANHFLNTGDPHWRK